MDFLLSVYEKILWAAISGHFILALFLFHIYFYFYFILFYLFFIFINIVKVSHLFHFTHEALMSLLVHSVVTTTKNIYDDFALSLKCSRKPAADTWDFTYCVPVHDILEETVIAT